MKIIALVVAALFGFWIVSALMDWAKTRSGGAGAGSMQTSNELEAACRLLEIGRSFTADELEAAYQKRLQAYQPAPLADLGTEIQELAARKTEEIQQAYALLKPHAAPSRSF